MSNSEKTVPLIDGGTVSMRHAVMQDNTSVHTAGRNLKELVENPISTIDRPCGSPDRNPIEAVWNKVRDLNQLYYPT